VDEELIMRDKKFLLLTAALFTCLHASADPVSDATTLTDEALSILKANATKEAPPEEYAKCIYNLERAQALLDGAGENDSPLAQKVSSSLFWARRFSNLKVISALEALRGKQPVVAKTKPVAKAATTPPPANAKATTNETPEMIRNRVAEAAFSAVEKYAASAQDEYVAALAWFKMAGEHPGTDAALKALELARQAQLRFTGKKAAVEEELPDTPEAHLIREADALVKSKKYEAAFPLYEQSIKLKDTLVAHRRKANAHYQRAQQIREELKPKFAAHNTAYQAAYQNSWVTNRSGKFFEPNSVAMVNWKRGLALLQKEGDVANKNFEAAEHEFAKVLKLAPEGKDFEAAGYMGLCIGVRPFFRSKGISTIDAFINNYTPADDVQRSLYEFCKTEMESLRKGG
jgi:tetratricopeptide (TPR) repeat protein